MRANLQFTAFVRIKRDALNQNKQRFQRNGRENIISSGQLPSCNIREYPAERFQAVLHHRPLLYKKR